MKKTIWSAVIGVGAVAGVLGALYGIDSNYVRQNFHALCQAQTERALEGIQKQITVQRAYDEVYFWQRMEVELTTAVAMHPGDEALRGKLEQVREKRVEAERRLEGVK